MSTRQSEKLKIGHRPQTKDQRFLRVLVYGLWPMVYGLWFTVFGLRSLVFGLFLIFHFSFLISSHAGGAVAKRQEAQKKMMQQRGRQTQGAVQQRQQQMILEKQRYEQELLEHAHQSEAPEKPDIVDEQVEDVVTLDQLLASLETSSEAWPLIIDKEVKSAVISTYIVQYRGQGIEINKPPVYYAGLFDEMSRQTPDILHQPFKQVLRVMAVLDYDFNNGQDKDSMALKLLGSQQAVAANKKRLGI